MEASIKNPVPVQPPTGNKPAAAPLPDPVQATLERARNGDMTVLPQLKKVLDDNPEIWAKCYQLTAMTEQGWLDKIAGKDLVLSQSIRRHVEQLKTEVAGPAPSPIEKLLAERIAISWLGAQHAELSETCGEAGGIKTAQLRLTRLESSHRRLLAATKALAVVRRLAHGLKVEIRHTHDPAPAQAPIGTSAPRNGNVNDANGSVTSDPVRERLRSMFSERAGVDKETTSLVNA